MILLFFIATILLQGLVMGCLAFSGVQICKLKVLPWHWRVYFSAPFFGFAFYALLVLITAPFAPRPTSIVLWTSIVRLSGLLALAGCAALPTLFFFGWINGGFVPAKKDKETQ